VVRFRTAKILEYKSDLNQHSNYVSSDSSGNPSATLLILLEKLLPLPKETLPSHLASVELALLLKALAYSQSQRPKQQDKASFGELQGPIA